MPIYTAYNAPMQTTAAIAAVTTGTAIKTMLQIASPATRGITILSWGYSLSVAPGAASTVELMQTDVAGTVTAHSASGVQPLNSGETASLVTLGTEATGYTCTAEDTTTAARTFDTVIVPLTAGASDLTYRMSFPPLERPWVPVSRFVRVRITVTVSAANMLCWVRWAE